MTRRDELLTVAQVLDELGGVSRRAFSAGARSVRRQRASSCPTANSVSTGASSLRGLRACGRPREHLLRREVLGNHAERVE